MLLTLLFLVEGLVLLVVGVLGGCLLPLALIARFLIKKSNLFGLDDLMRAFSGAQLRDHDSSIPVTSEELA